MCRGDEEQGGRPWLHDLFHRNGRISHQFNEVGMGQHAALGSTGRTGGVNQSRHIGAFGGGAALF